ACRSSLSPLLQPLYVLLSPSSGCFALCGGRKLESQPLDRPRQRVTRLSSETLQEEEWNPIRDEQR
uniref:hypothetical protein n=1 Tax=Acetomicrobium sp. S15 = DSM 107314 TaxID=2529858 RepID=UPI001E61576A